MVTHNIPTIEEIRTMHNFSIKDHDIIEYLLKWSKDNNDLLIKLKLDPRAVFAYLYPTPVCPKVIQWYDYDKIKIENDKLENNIIDEEDENLN